MLLNQLAYPASKFAAEKELRESGLNWSILRFPFIYGDKDGHLESVPKIAINARWHPRSKGEHVHHRDIANATNLALAGVIHGRVVNIVDDRRPRSTSSPSWSVKRSTAGESLAHPCRRLACS